MEILFFFKNFVETPQKSQEIELYLIKYSQLHKRLIRLNKSNYFITNKKTEKLLVCAI